MDSARRLATLHLIWSEHRLKRGGLPPSTLFLAAAQQAVCGAAHSLLSAVRCL
jgi:hypothetical protein